MVEDRKVGVATDFSKSSNSALKWAIENMADKGDTFYIIHVMSDGSRTNIWAKSGSREFLPSLICVLANLSLYPFICDRNYNIKLFMFLIEKFTLLCWCLTVYLEFTLDLILFCSSYSFVNFKTTRGNEQLWCAN